MYDAVGFQVQYDDRERQFARLNSDGWQFDSPVARTRPRVAVARALIALATRLAPAVREAGSGDPAPSEPQLMPVRRSF